jgi:hypothetical protein
MGTEEKALTTAVSAGGIELRSMDDLKLMAQTVINAKLAPAGIESPAQALIALEVGLEAGFKPMQGLRAVTVINNRPSWLGKAALALVRQRGVLKQSPGRKYLGGFDPSKKGLQRYEDDYRCVVTLWRVGDPEPHDFEYSVDDAKLAGLWNPSNPKKPWATAPKRMLYWRAIGQGMDELFSDVLLGLPLAEVAQDFGDEARGFERAKDVTPALPAETAPDPILEHFEKTEAGEEPDAELPEVLDPEIVEPEPEPPKKATKARRKKQDGRAREKATKADELLGDQAASTARAPVHEETDPLGEEPPPEEPEGCDHEWKMAGDPSSDAEPSLVCEKCGLTDEEVQTELGL